MTWTVCYHRPEHYYHQIPDDAQPCGEVVAWGLPDKLADLVEGFLASLPCPRATRGYFCYCHGLWTELGPPDPHLERVEESAREVVRELCRWHHAWEEVSSLKQ